jgi:hypothetical protein
VQPVLKEVLGEILTAIKIVAGPSEQVKTAGDAAKSASTLTVKNRFNRLILKPEWFLMEPS